MPLSVDDRIQFIHMHRQGYSGENLVQRALEHKQQELEEKVNKITQALLERQKNVGAIADQLIQEIDAMDTLGACKFQNDHLSQTISNLQQTQRDLTFSVVQREKELFQRKLQVAVLKRSLDGFAHTLPVKRPPCEASLFLCGQEFSKYISQNVN